MQIDLAGRVALVTGASAGIGAATVRSLAAAGARVAFCARSKGGVDELARELTARGNDVRGYVADMAVADEISAFLDHVDADLGAVDILVNNVGGSPSRNFLYMSDDDWTSLFELNLMSAVRCSRRLLPAMRAAQWGRIVMVSTAAAKYPSAPLIDYSASKAAMIATGKALSMRYGADNVLVNSVLPGLIDTPMWERTADEVGQATGRSPEQVIDAMARSVPLGRYGTADEVANLIVFLCSDAASYINGAAIRWTEGRAQRSSDPGRPEPPITYRIWRARRDSKLPSRRWRWTTPDSRRFKPYERAVRFAKSSGKYMSDLLHVDAGGVGRLLGVASESACVQVGGVPVPPVVLRSDLLKVVVMFMTSPGRSSSSSSALRPQRARSFTTARPRYLAAWSSSKSDAQSR